MSEPFIRVPSIIQHYIEQLMMPAAVEEERERRGVIKALLGFMQI